MDTNHLHPGRLTAGSPTSHPLRKEDDRNQTSNFCVPAVNPSTWKWMIGRRSFPFGMAYFQVRTVSFREGTNHLSFLFRVFFIHLQNISAFKIIQPAEFVDPLTLGPQEWWIIREKFIGWALNGVTCFTFFWYKLTENFGKSWKPTKTSQTCCCWKGRKGWILFGETPSENNNMLNPANGDLVQMIFPFQSFSKKGSLLKFSYFLSARGLLYTFL